MLKRFSQFLSTLVQPKLPLPKPKINHAQAMAIAKELFLINGRFWDDHTATARLHDKQLPMLCWEISPGVEPKEWAEQEMDDYSPGMFINAETGEFVGLSYTRHIALAEEIVGKHFKLR